MIYIEQNATNNIFVNVSQYKTGAFGANPRYLWRLQNAQGRNIVSFYPENSTATYPSMYANRYDVFSFDTFKNLPQNFNYTGGTPCNIHLENENQYWLGIYEMPSGSTSYNPSGEKLLNSLAFIFVDKENEFYTGNTANFEPNKIYYKTGNGITPTPSPEPQPTPTPTPTPSATPEPPTPFSMAVYQGVPDNQFFYASIFDGDGNYYSIVNLNQSNLSPILYQFPASELISTQLGYAEDTGLIVDEFLCYGFQVSGEYNPDPSIHLEYLDCDGNFVVEDITGGGEYNFCARYLLAGTYQNGKGVIQYGLCSEPPPSPTPTPTPSATPPVVWYSYRLDDCNTGQSLGFFNLPVYASDEYRWTAKLPDGSCGYSSYPNAENPSVPYLTEYWDNNIVGNGCIPCEAAPIPTPTPSPQPPPYYKYNVYNCNTLQFIGQYNFAMYDNSGSFWRLVKTNDGTCVWLGSNQGAENPEAPYITNTTSYNSCVECNM